MRSALLPLVIGVIVGVAVGFAIWGTTGLPEFRFRFELGPDGVFGPASVECEKGRLGRATTVTYLPEVFRNLQPTTSEGPRWVSIAFERPDGEGCVTIGEEPVDPASQDCAARQKRYCEECVQKQPPDPSCREQEDYFDTHHRCDRPVTCSTDNTPIETAP